MGSLRSAEDGAGVRGGLMAKKHGRCGLGRGWGVLRTRPLGPAPLHTSFSKKSLWKLGSVCPVPVQRELVCLGAECAWPVQPLGVWLLPDRSLPLLEHPPATWGSEGHVREVSSERGEVKEGTVPEGSGLIRPHHNKDF